MRFIFYFKIIYNADTFCIERITQAKNFKKLNKKVQEYLSSKCMKNKTNELLDELYLISSNNVWINYFKKCIEEHKIRGENWIDFEYEISEVIKGLDYLQKYLEERRRKGSEASIIDDKVLYKKGKDFLTNIKSGKESEFIQEIDVNNFYGNKAKKIISILNEELNNLIRCFEIYLKDVVGMINIENQLRDINEIKSIDKLISFNYTDTFKKIYDEDNQVDVDYIHGRVGISKDITDNNMVLGIGEYLHGNEEKEEGDFIQFKKYYQRIYKNTGRKYKHWIAKIKSIKENMPVDVLNRNNDSGFANNIYIYGHSLGITDKDIFEELLLLPNSKVTIFYYDNDDYEQKIKNIVALIGKDKLSGIVFKEIQKEI